MKQKGTKKVDTCANGNTVNGTFCKHQIITLT